MRTHEKMIVAGELQLEKLKEKSFDFGLAFQIPVGLDYQLN